MLRMLAKLFKALNSEQNPSQLAIAISLAVILGLTPLFSLHNLIVVLAALWFRVNLTLIFISYPIFAFVGFILSPIFNDVGIYILNLSTLAPLWEIFFNTLVGRWSNFYYGGVMGSFIVSLVVAIAIYPIAKVLVVKYRKVLLEKVQQFRVVQFIKASNFWKFYSQ